MNESLVLCVTWHWVRTQDEEGGCRILECRLGIKALSALTGPVLETGSGCKSHVQLQVVRWVTWGQTLDKASSPHMEENEQGCLISFGFVIVSTYQKGGNNPWLVRICRQRKEACQRELTGI